jgi:hypothetical protein
MWSDFVFFSWLSSFIATSNFKHKNGVVNKVHKIKLHELGSYWSKYKIIPETQPSYSHDDMGNVKT